VCLVPVNAAQPLAGGGEASQSAPRAQHAPCPRRMMVVAVVTPERGNLVEGCCRGAWVRRAAACDE
jgi:hypothetical protein